MQTKNAALFPLGENARHFPSYPGMRIQLRSSFLESFLNVVLPSAGFATSLPARKPILLASLLRIVVIMAGRALT